MASIHKETFDMYQYDKHNLILSPDDYFSVDEAIAPVIQLLNRKGYLTEWSCAGHSLVDGGFVKVEDENGKVEYSKTMKLPRTYISFKEGISLPMLPPGFELDERNKEYAVISKNYHNLLNFNDNYSGEFPQGSKEYDMLENALDMLRNNIDNKFFEVSRAILEAMEELYKWALDLPDFKNEGLNE